METKDLIKLIERMDNSGLARFRLREGDFELEIERIHKNSGGVHESIPADRAGAEGSHPPAGPGQYNSSAPRPEEADAGEAENAENGVEHITSPIVGSFYRAPSPDAPPYVEEGSEIAQGETLCIIEAMKVMNELEAEFPCRILKVLAENQQMVEYGTPLFEVERLE